MEFIEIPIRGGGYYSYGAREPDNKCYVQPIVLATLGIVAGRFYKATGGFIGIGNGSLSKPGRVEPHNSHQSGNDIDIRYPRRDLKERGVTIDSVDYDRNRSILLAVMIIEEGFDRILTSDDGLISLINRMVQNRPETNAFLRGRVRLEPAHGDHMHCTWGAAITV
jgi:hypothetical protein